MQNVSLSLQIDPEKVYKISNKEAEDFKRQEQDAALDIAVHEAEIDFRLKKITEIQDSRHDKMMELWESEFDGTLLERAMIIMDRVRDFHQEIDDMQ